MNKIGNKDKIDEKMIVDSLEVARNKFPGSSNSLDALCKNLTLTYQKELNIMPY